MVNMAISACGIIFLATALIASYKYLTPTREQLLVYDKDEQISKRIK